MNGFGRVRVEAPELACGTTQLMWMRSIALVYGIVFVVGIPVLVFLHLVALRQKNKLRDARVLRTYGFLYDHLGSHALFWKFGQQLKQVCLVVCRVFLWKYPLAQGYAAIAILLGSIWYQSATQPYLKPVLNALEQCGLVLRQPVVTESTVPSSTAAPASS